ncbi:hypoxanthine phosphoribosyltransferase [Buchnera aphidicola str. APS (Acyrthosiphon pisum)]|uniref:Hypoxanthine phosphoribosyltransferase n=1 Tax=Buchnera aphidicola subsp. Acyrthosiphon pisum (strain 5A) TaxID=563178 RepID=A0A7U4DID5_BUCA5|nr:hypoxanthine phosphoribosyltransferase [Buchnera aphidicola]ADP66590.1 hypoxanthine phosphoribosyltransferase [Buchnera aphidicola str. TLW03 (Acyrthosiphon pisum)]ADP67719.1 hypoxanthine phosphoribosyltransferase [Buchnera aphidicola str. JF98 (Acyrthosiphon pisum)]OQX99590.1 MAG: hypoxanthine phosphoribosyltransferase [Erwiniaceae bacterium 4572_131]ACL30014.1 hypoxanthine phosphoribosyltransferase [Buchnera aphidicola str. Tuc7 (Acyrthosiphon pisum)]ACL30565.1 hypoxanthine phosphoribosyl
MKHTLQVIITEKELDIRVRELGQEITKKYRNSRNKMILIALLRGSFIFISDLCRRIHIEHEIDFMTTSSYGRGMLSSGDVKIIKDLDEDIYNKNVLIVEDIIDSGKTLSKVLDILKLRNPKSLSICTLLDKPECREVNINVDFIGFSILENFFIVGYGIDYAQSYRYLPYIGKVVFKK